MLVVYVNTSHRSDYLELPKKLAPLAAGLRNVQAFLTGTWGTEINDELSPMKNDIAISNSSTSAFFDTELNTLFRNQGITELVLSGLATNWVVESTARGCF